MDAFRGQNGQLPFSLLQQARPIRPTQTHLACPQCEEQSNEMNLAGMVRGGYMMMPQCQLPT
jgi:hypothetical protein